MLPVICIIIAGLVVIFALIYEWLFLRPNYDEKIISGGDFPKEDLEESDDEFKENKIKHKPQTKESAHNRIKRIVQKSYRDIKERMGKPFMETLTKKIIEAYDEKIPRKPEILLEDIKDSLEYKGGGRLYGYSIHLGQRKLFLTELQFLTKHTNPEKVSIVVYAGAAPNNKGQYLADLFPNVIFLYVDPNPLIIKDNLNPVQFYQLPSNMPDLPSPDDIKSWLVVVKDAANDVQELLDSGGEERKNRIYIIRDFFTPKIASACEEVFGKEQFLFVSDIRTNIHASRGHTGNSDDEMPGTLDVIWNMAQTFNWMRIMKPAYSMLKFRHPFYESGGIETMIKSVVPGSMYYDDFERAKKKEFGINGIDFIANAKEKKMIFWKGDVYVQAWAGKRSTESRLVTDAKSLQSYDIHEYDNRYDYYNKVSRKFAYYENTNADKRIGFDHCADCSKENAMWTEYLDKFGTPTDNPDYRRFKVIDYVRVLTEFTNPEFKSTLHGHFFDKDKNSRLIKTVTVPPKHLPYKRGKVTATTDEYKKKEETIHHNNKKHRH